MRGGEGRLVETLPSVSLETGSGGERTREEFLLELSKMVDDVMMGPEWSGARVAAADYASGCQAPCEALAGLIVGLKPLPRASYNVLGLGDEPFPIELQRKAKLFPGISLFNSLVAVGVGRRVGGGWE